MQAKAQRPFTKQLGMAAVTRGLHCIALLLAMAAVALLSLGAEAQQGSCQQDLNDLVLHCREFVLIPGPVKDPSKECCDVVQRADVPCVCSHVNKEVEKIISMAKVVHVADYCKRPLPHGSKCGSYTVPAA